MFDNVLVGVDGQQGGRDASALARMLVADGGKLTFEYVYHGDPHVWRGSRPPFEAGEEEHARELLVKAAGDAGVAPDLRVHGAASVGRGLHDLAETIGADLIVVGSSRRGLVGRVLLGDDTRAALNVAPSAVAIAPADYARHPAAIEAIGVGYNGSSESAHVLKIARSIAAALHSTVSVLETVSAPAFLLSAGPMVPGDALAALLEDADSELAELKDVDPHACYGQPAEELAIFSASVDLLVVGSRSYGPVGRLVHGSTSQQLARTARCPLLILTRAARAAAAVTSSTDSQGATVATGA